ncbi:MULTISPECIES: DUF2156 domain-containing protein [Terrabacteria group]|uniref:DUF2156 domain-containing protein n=1 Tax=Bacillati TaxID=1783272 RepID=UPI0019399BF1|nr:MULTISPECIES: phosphatidylglycerol lysyltransferase domain-containing protein [Terrabacteria group]MBW9212456.1 DUF2156 domain-containing protein [Trueperella sp. zg.1013]QRG86787.1 DUF2156 domain-containing protein [Bulleidia sp. zg-1006]
MLVENIKNDFMPISLKDWQWVQTYLEKSDYEESNHNIVNMMLWLKEYPLFVKEEEHYLLLLGIHEGQLFVYMPLAEEGYLREALLDARQIFDFYGVPFCLSCYTKEVMDFVLEVFSDLSAVEERSAADYVYEADKLRTFSGKKLQKKRNHINGFLKEYEGRWTYEKINSENVGECLEFLENWRSDDPDDFLQSERMGVEKILHLVDVLPYKGGLIRIDGKVKAFAIGSLLTKRMAQENIEKADSSIRGLYPMILKEWLGHEYPGVELLNREDDTGRDNLRYAKMSLHPLYLIKKYRIKRSDEDDSKSSFFTNGRN